MMIRLKLTLSLLAMQTVFSLDCLSQSQAAFRIPGYWKIPHQYTIAKTDASISIDGKAEEEAWNKAPWTVYFTDISTGENVPENQRARAKMLWDNENLYVFAELKEQDIWATITHRDDAVFQDNALEIFINPDGSTFNYFEFQINALETVWDLFLPRPYRSGGRGLSSWDINGLQKAVYIDGTLNDPSDKDKSWSVELAIPFTSLGVRGGVIRSGTIWRMNFSRVQWKTILSEDGTYKRILNETTGRPIEPGYFVWSPQGLVDLHYPEKYGYVKFSDSFGDGKFLDDKTEQFKLVLWKYFYLQKKYKDINNIYASGLADLDQINDGLPDWRIDGMNIELFADDHQFLLNGKVSSSDIHFTLDHEGEYVDIGARNRMRANFK